MKNFLSIVLALAAACSFANHHTAHAAHLPSSFHFYLHDNSLYKNASFNTAVVDAPASQTIGTAFQFGKLYVFDDPITAGPAISSKRIGSAQGIYVYSGRTNSSAFWALTAFIDAGDTKGSLSFMGAEVIPQSTRDIPVVGGTGDFVKARGIATLVTTAITLPGRRKAEWLKHAESGKDAQRYEEREIWDVVQDAKSKRKLSSECSA